MAEISVIVPVYNVESYLHRCVDSILAQTFTDFELILVDDGSPDGCPAMCDEYAKKDSRVVVIHQKNGGLSAARNAGIDWTFANSDSQWLSFIDSDDWVHPEFLERLLYAAVSYNQTVSVCGYFETEGTEPLIGPEQLRVQLWKPESFFVEHNVNAIVAWGKLYAKSCFYQIRYPVGKIHEDEFTTYKILFSYPEIAVIGAPLYFYYQNPAGIMSSSWNKKRMAAYDALEEQIEFFFDNGFYNAQRSVIRRYLTSITNKICDISRDPNNKVVRLQLKKKRKRYFLKYAMQLDMNDEADTWVLTKVFPVCMKVYWYHHAFLRKFGICISGRNRRAL